METSKKRKILIIENQYTQFCEIHQNLDNVTFVKFPDSDQSKYIAFIDNVRVWVNDRYEEVLRDNAFENISKIINNEDNKIELILMDHILGGAHHCKTGIDLAYEINKPRKENNQIIPILFLSKTKTDDKIREIGYGKLNGINAYAKEFGEANYKWVHKGYFGDEILKEDYFRANVMPEINKLLGDSEAERFNRLIEKLVGLNYNQDNVDAKTKLEELLNTQSINNNIISSITSIYNDNIQSNSHLIPEKLKAYFENSNS